MEKFIKIKFENENQAYLASQNIYNLHINGELAIAGLIILTKKENNQVEIKNIKGETTSYTVGGVITGALLGLLGGPLGLIWGAGLGFIAGVTGDLLKAENYQFSLDQAVKSLDENATYILMHADETWEVPLNVTLESFNVEINRIDVSLEIENKIKKDLEEIQDEIEDLREDLEEASTTEKEKIKTKIADLKIKRKDLGEKLKAKSDAQKVLYQTWFEKIKYKFNKIKDKAKYEIKDEYEDFKEDMQELIDKK